MTLEYIYAAIGFAYAVLRIYEKVWLFAFPDLLAVWVIVIITIWGKCAKISS